MVGLITWRRLAGALLGGGAFIAAIYGVANDDWATLTVGLAVLAFLAVCLMLAMFQRMIMLIRMVAATRHDLQRIEAFHARFPSELRGGLAKHADLSRSESGKAREEFLRLRREIKRDTGRLMDGMVSIGSEQAAIASMNAIQQITLVATLSEASSSQLSALSQLSERLEVLGEKALAAEAIDARFSRLTENLEALGEEIRALSQSDEGIAGALSKQEGAHEDLRRTVLEGASTALRSYRDMRAELDRWQEALSASEMRLAESQAKAGASVESHLVEVLELLSTAAATQPSVMAELHQISSAQGDIGGGLGALAQQFSGASTGLLGKLEEVAGGIDGLAKGYQADRTALISLSHDEKMLRSISRRGMQWLKYETVREFEALLQLRSMVGGTDPTPLLGGWAMDPEAMLALVKLVLDSKPGLIVELGSGTSTVWLAMAIRELGAGKIISYDHLEEYAAKTRQALARLGLEEWAEVRTVSLSSQQIAGNSFDWYDIPEPGVDGEVDVLIVDGPPGSTGPRARYPAVPRFLGTLHPASMIVIDDATRDDEKKVIAQWRQEFPALRESTMLGTRTLVLDLGGENARGASEGA